jgi:hypothetical protein
VATENAQKRGSREPGSASENTTAVPRRRRGRAPLELPDQFGAVLEDYIHALATAPRRPIAWDSSGSPEPLSLPDPTGPGPGSRMPAVKNVGEPCAGKPLARIDAAAVLDATRERLFRQLADAIDTDPIDVLPIITALQKETDEHLRKALRHAAASSSWREIAAALGVSKQAAHQRFKAYADGVAEEMKTHQSSTDFSASPPGEASVSLVVRGCRRRVAAARRRRASAGSEAWPAPRAPGPRARGLRLRRGAARCSAAQ